MWRHVVASSEEGEEADSSGFVQQMMGFLGTGFSFSGYERDQLMLNLGNGKFLDISGVSGMDSITDGRGAVFADFGRFNITATVDNVFDENYFVPLQGVYEEVAALPGTGRAYLLTARVNF